MPSKKQVGRARELRKSMNFAEVKVWQALRQSVREGIRVRRQHPVGPFILDFYCHSARLALELDGSSHEGDGKADAARDAWLNKNGITVLRAWNSLTDNDNVYTLVNWFLDECELRNQS
ncbi:MAG: DUF559 domain-containing protein [Armatimonadetes bacterium]|nr:DUF559 domain-containing protein [Armatimonadota bacterium]